jgi:hypothetical protein
LQGYIIPANMLFDINLKMKILKTIFEYISISLFILIIIIILFAYNKNPYNIELSNWNAGINKTLAESFGEFFGGVIGTLLSFLSVLLLIYTIIKQNIERKKDLLKENFFRMLDYHNQNVSQLSVPDVYNDNNKSEHRRAFVQYKIQIHELLRLVKKMGHSKEDIPDIAYIIFYYGIDKEWLPFVEKKLSKYKQTLAGKILKKINCYKPQISNNKLSAIERVLKKKLKNKKDVVLKTIEYLKKNNTRLKLGRTNQTNLSVYFKNMYNAIKMVDDSSLFSKEEKQELIDIYKAQLSTPELYVILFHFISIFGTTKPYEKWKKYQETYKIFNDEDLSNEFFDGYTIEDCFKKISLTEKAD